MMAAGEKLQRLGRNKLARFGDKAGRRFLVKISITTSGCAFARFGLHHLGTRFDGRGGDHRGGVIYKLRYSLWHGFACRPGYNFGHRLQSLLLRRFPLVRQQLLDRFDQRQTSSRLRQHTRNSDPPRLEIHFRRIMNREQDDRRGRQLLRNLARYLQPVHIGHCEIKNNDVGLEFLRLCYRLAPVLRYGNFPSCITLKHEMKEFSHQLVIVGD